MDVNVNPIAGNYLLNTTHNLQANANTYFLEQKYVSIHSQDRNIISYPSSGEFIITLPQHINNVAKVKLSTFDFPANYEVFSRERDNTKLAVSIVDPYLPNTFPTLLSEAIYDCLVAIKNTILTVEIGGGFYTPTQMTTELTNRLNKAISDQLNAFVLNNLDKYGILLPITDNTYNRFVVIYNEVKQNIWFGNTADQFTLNNSNIFAFTQGNVAIQCKLHPLPDFMNWGLPSNLGLRRTDMTSTEAPFMRVYYGSITPGDDGYWLLPDTTLGNTMVYFVECPFKTNLMGFANLYLSIEHLNCIDITSPFYANINPGKTDKILGTVDGAFAKIQIPTTPLSQWFGVALEQSPYRHFAPTREKICQLNIKLTYHDGTIVNMQNFEYSFLLEFTVLVPQLLRKGEVCSAMQGFLVNR